MDQLGPISWILLIGGGWVLLTLLLSVFWNRAKRSQPRITHKQDAEV
jgi:hypothetical protein